MSNCKGDLFADEEGRPGAHGPGKWMTIAQAGVIFTAVLWIFRPALRGDWLWDDTELIQGNLLMHDPGGWWRIWLLPGQLIDFQPITSTVFWMEWHCFGNATIGYHLVNAFLHGMGALLVWRLFARLGIRAAWLGGLIFAVHPVLVESVAWISELKNVLSLPPFLLALLAWLDFSDAGSRRDYGRAFGWFLVALLCKATVVMFPVVILLHAWWRRGRIEARDLRASAPFFLLSLLFGALTIWFLHHHTLERPELPLLGGFFARLANAGLIFAFYLGKCFWPVELLPVYPQWGIEPVSPFSYLIWALLGLIVAGLWIKRRIWGRHGLFALGFFFINLAPFLGFTAGSYMAFTWVMDHILYVPIIGLIGLVAAGWGALEVRLARPFHFGLVAVTAALLALLICDGNSYARIFQNSPRLWTYAARLNPQSWIAQANLGLAREQNGWHEEALSRYELASALRPFDATLHCNVGKLLDEEGQMPTALKQYARALELDPRSAIAHCNRGVAYTQLGRLPEAIADYEQALATQPDYPEAESDLGVALMESGRPVEAIAHYQAAVRLNPEYVMARSNLGDALGETGHFAEALEQYRAVLQLQPGNAEAYYNCGVALTRLGRISEAMDAYRTALRLNPNYTNARNNLSALEHAPAER